MSGICASQRLDGSSMTVSFPPRAVTCSVDTRVQMSSSRSLCFTFHHRLRGIPVFIRAEANGRDRATATPPARASNQQGNENRPGIIVSLPHVWMESRAVPHPRPRSSTRRASELSASADGSCTLWPSAVFCRPATA
jgi:hypothetical protein